MAKQAKPGYLAEVYRKIAVRYIIMAEDMLRSPERRGGDGSDRDWMNSWPPY